MDDMLLMSNNSMGIKKLKQGLMAEFEMKATYSSASYEARLDLGAATKIRRIIYIIMDMEK